MTKAEAKAMLKRIQEPEAWEPQINQAAFEALDMAIEALDCSESPNSSDTISRQAAIDALADMHCKSDEDGYVWIIRSDAWARIDALPSVTPKRKTGKWLPENRTNDAFWVCSACGFQSEAHSANILYNYCPNCGARMTEEDV